MHDNDFIFSELLWAGDEHSLLIARQAMVQVMKAGPFDKDEDEDLPYNYERIGNVGVVKIKGSLVNNDSPWNRYFGVTSYNDVRAAMVAAVNDQEVGVILLDINSGGGAVSGVADTAEFIASIDKSIKPVYSITDGTMASAAYWLGVSGRAVYNSRTAVLGSIGVITSHTDYSEMRQKAGIKDTVLRAGEFKALATPMEPLSDAARKQITDMIEATYSVFRDHVASQLGVTAGHADETFARGRIFVGQAAVDVGLSKGVRNFESVLTQLQSESVDTIAGKAHTRAAHNPLIPMKTTLTPQQLAAIQAGAPVSTEGQGAASTEQSTAPAASTETSAATTEQSTAPAATTEQSAAPAPKGDGEVVSFLRGELKDAQATITSMTVEAAQLKARVTEMESTHASLLAIATQSLSNMRVALGGSAVAAGSMSAEQLLAEHATAKATFEEKFRAGGVAATAPAEGKGSDAQAVTPHWAARVAATSLR